MFQRMAPETKKFNGRMYRFLEGHRTKAAAKAQAKAERKKGYKVRVVSFPQWHGYFVYVKK